MITFDTAVNILEKALTVGAIIFGWMAKREAKQAKDKAKEAQPVIDWLLKRRERVVPIIILENNEDDADLVSRMLDKYKINHSVYHDEDEFRKEMPDEASVVLLDHFLNKTNGLEIIREIKNKNMGSLPIIFTGSNDPELAITYLNSGAFRYVSKNDPDYLETLKLFISEAIFIISNR